MKIYSFEKQEAWQHARNLPYGFIE